MVVCVERVALKCKKPFMVAGYQPVGCGHCTDCKISRASVKAARLELEWLAFGGVGLSTTLTFAQEHLPAGGHVSRRLQQLYCKRVRRSVDGRAPCRPVGIAEYGRQTFRAHYHLQWPGLGWQYSELLRSQWCDPETGELLGHVDVKPMDSGSIEYWRDHLVSCWSQEDDPRLKRLGLEPEFAIWPRRPGLGIPAVPFIADAMRKAGGRELVERMGDVPGSLASGRRPMPLDRLMKAALRAELLTEQEAAELAARRKAEFAARCRDGEAVHGRSVWRFGQPFVEHQRMVQREARRKIFRKRNSL